MNETLKSVSPPLRVKNLNTDLRDGVIQRHRVLKTKTGRSSDHPHLTHLSKKDPSTAMSQFRAFKELSKSSSHIENHAFKVVHQRENLSNALNTMTSMGIRVNNFSVEGSFGGIFFKSSLPNRSDGRKYKSCHGLVMEAVEIF